MGSIQTAIYREEPTTGQRVYDVVKAPVGWSVVCDGERIGGVYGMKEAALEAITATRRVMTVEGEAPPPLIGMGWNA